MTKEPGTPVYNQRPRVYSRFALIAGVTPAVPANRLSDSLKPEVGAVNTPISQLHHQLPARPSPGRFCLPDVDILVGGGVVAKATARRHCVLQRDRRIR